MVIGALMMLVGFTLMLWPVIAANRLHAADPRLITGFITVATGAMMLTRTGIALFFYFLYVVSFLIFQIRHHDILSSMGLLLLAMLAAGIYLLKSLKKRRARR